MLLLVLLLTLLTRHRISLFFFFNDTATTEIYTLSLHDALPIYKTVHPAVVVDVRGHHSPGFGRIIGNPRLTADIGERAITGIVEEPARHGIVDARDAVIAVARLAVPAELVFAFVEVHEAADEQV